MTVRGTGAGPGVEAGSRAVESGRRSALVAAPSTGPSPGELPQAESGAEAGELTLDGPCHIWSGQTYRGYPVFGPPAGPFLHVIVHDMVHGTPPKGWQRHHRGGRKRCLNPAHLTAMPAVEHLRVHARPALATRRLSGA